MERHVNIPDKERNKSYEVLLAFGGCSQELALSAGIADS